MVISSSKAPSNLTPLEYLKYFGWDVPTSGCWVFRGPRHKDGYGTVAYGITKLRASRVAYTEWVGELKPEDKVLHTCDNPPCINPKHLWKGTQQENIADMIAKGRAVPPTPLPGDLSPNRKLNSNQVLEIRSRYAAGEKLTPLSFEFGLTPSGIHAIVNRKNWRSI